MLFLIISNFSDEYLQLRGKNATVFDLFAPASGDTSTKALLFLSQKIDFRPVAIKKWYRNKKLTMMRKHQK